ncbi:MAG: nucleotide sugar dehydrogenase [Deltaproteobacteria bacterium]|nr:nucleotide sugar dehydrogenase [Deltaproteobacteria bacterium]
MNRKIAVVGLGYVGLPLAVAFGKKTSIIGFDVKSSRIAELKAGLDRTGEVSDEDLASTSIDYTSDAARLQETDFIIIAVPTPIDKAHRPDLTPLVKASMTVGQNLTSGAIVVYESTVYPGATEEDCVPVLERESGLVCGKDFFVGYSPERINPGDKVHRLETVTKIVSGQTTEVLDVVAEVYGMVVTAGVHRAASIKVAEAAKVIENTQRDLNIALVNELSMIFGLMGIDTLDVLEAAGTKWNFLPFRPGLVGGHCIGVDPYYLTHKAEEIGYHPQVILAGRRINDGMAQYVVAQVLKMLIHAGTCTKEARVGILGLTFKEDCPDLRNSKVFDIVSGLKEYGLRVLACDPVADFDEICARANGVTLSAEADLQALDAVIVAVAHRQFKDAGAKKIAAMVKPGGVIADLKGVFAKEDFPGASYWRL